MSVKLSAAALCSGMQSCSTLCDPMDCSPSGSPVPGILQARTLEWVAISFSNAGKWKVKVKSLSHVRLLATPWTAADQAPLSMGFSRQEYWSGLPLPSPVKLRVWSKYGNCYKEAIGPKWIQLCLAHISKSRLNIEPNCNLSLSKECDV